MSDQMFPAAAARVDLIVSGAVTIGQGCDGEWFVLCVSCEHEPAPGLMVEMDETWRGTRGVGRA